MVTHQLVTHFICARPAVRFWNVPHRQSSCAPLRHCRLTRCLAAPSGQDGSQSTALCWFPSYPNQWWGDRGCGPRSSGGLGSLLFSAAVWPRGGSAGPQPGGARCDRYAAPVKQQGGKGISINKETNKDFLFFPYRRGVSYLCINVSSQIYQSLHQWEETLHWSQVEAVLTCTTQKRKRKIKSWFQSDTATEIFFPYSFVILSN